MKRTTKWVNGVLVWEPPFPESHNEAERFDEMVASGVAPGCMTDSVFLSGQCNGSQFEGQPHVGDLFKKIAAAEGVDVQGKTYLGSLAERPGDPRAWVSGRGDVRKVLEDRGWGSDGAVTVKQRTDIAPPKPIGVADDLVEAYTEKRLASDPAAAERPRDEVRAEVRDEIKPHWVKD